MAMSEADQKNGGQVMMKFLLLDDVDSARMFLQSLETDMDKLGVLWATIAVQNGAVKSLAEQVGVDPVMVIDRLITKHAMGIED